MLVAKQELHVAIDHIALIVLRAKVVEQLAALGKIAWNGRALFVAE